jgi:2-aminoadipate transaminase
MKVEDFYSETAKVIRSSEIRDLLKIVSKPEIISFAGGMPDPNMFPKEELAEITRDVSLNRTKLAYQYGPTEGIPELRRQVAEEEGKRGIEATPEQVLILSGSQQALDLVGKIFLNPGDLIMVEEPTYLGALNAFRQYRCKFVSLALDSEGIDVELAEEKLEQLAKTGKLPKFIYTVPTFQNPAGCVMSVSRRKELIDLVKKYGIFLIEDDPYSRLSFYGQAPPPIKALDPCNNIIYMSTFSKVLAPGIRLAYTIGRNEIIKKMIIAKQAVDLCTSPLSQFIAYEYCARGYEEKNLPKIIKTYKKKAEHMVKAFERFLPEGCTWNVPKGGMFTWVQTPKEVDTKEMFNTAIEKGVAYVIGTAFYSDGNGRNSMRVNFSYPTMEEIEEGVRRLSQVILEQQELGITNRIS